MYVLFQPGCHVHVDVEDLIKNNAENGSCRQRIAEKRLQERRELGKEFGHEIPAEDSKG